VRRDRGPGGAAQARRTAGAFVHQQIIWVKDRGVLTRSHYLWKHEPCFMGCPSPRQPATPAYCSALGSLRQTLGHCQHADKAVGPSTRMRRPSSNSQTHSSKQTDCGCKKGLDQDGYSRISPIISASDFPRSPQDWSAWATALLFSQDKLRENPRSAPQYTNREQDDLRNEKPFVLRNAVAEWFKDKDVCKNDYSPKDRSGKQESCPRTCVPQRCLHNEKQVWANLEPERSSYERQDENCYWRAKTNSTDVKDLHCDLKKEIQDNKRQTSDEKTDRRPNKPVTESVQGATTCIVCRKSLLCRFENSNGLPMAGRDTSEPRRTLNPAFVEALMGWPTGWTGFASVATALAGSLEPVAFTRSIPLVAAHALRTLAAELLADG